MPLETQSSTTNIHMPTMQTYEVMLVIKEYAPFV
jgi:hypothetical protein